MLGGGRLGGLVGWVGGLDGGRVGWGGGVVGRVGTGGWVGLVVTLGGL